MASAKEVSEVRESSPSVENVFDDDNISALNAAVDVLFDLDDARTAGCSVPTADLHEFELAFAAEFP